MIPSAGIQQSNPKTYRDREDWRDLNFYFISYSHKDRVDVFKALNELYDKSVNYWYDIELDPGDLWNERVKKVMDDKHCKGAILFLSERSLISDAVNKEIEYMMELQEQRKKQKQPEFQIIPIIMGGFDTAAPLIMKVGTDNLSFVEDGRMKRFLTVTEKKWLKENEAVKEIVASAERKEARASCLPTNINFVSVNGERTFLLGDYPTEEDGTSCKIEWLHICHRGQKYYFISKYCLDFVDHTATHSVIEAVKKTVGSVQNVENIILVNEKFINENAAKIPEALPSNYADKNRQQLLRLFWVLKEDGEKDSSLVLYNAKNRKVESSIQINKINAGVRLILILNDSEKNKLGGNENA